MGRWVSLYLNNEEYQKLQKILAAEEKRRGRKLSAYELIKEWVSERLAKYEGGN